MCAFDCVWGEALHLYHITTWERGYTYCSLFTPTCRRPFELGMQEWNNRERFPPSARVVWSHEPCSQPLTGWTFCTGRERSVRFQAYQGLPASHVELRVPTCKSGRKVVNELESCLQIQQASMDGAGGRARRKVGRIPMIHAIYMARRLWCTVADHGRSTYWILACARVLLRACAIAETQRCCSCQYWKAAASSGGKTPTVEHLRFLTTTAAAFVVNCHGGFHFATDISAGRGRPHAMIPVTHSWRSVQYAQASNWCFGLAGSDDSRVPRARLTHS